MTFMEWAVLLGALALGGMATALWLHSLLPVWWRQTTKLAIAAGLGVVAMAVVFVVVGTPGQ